VKRVRKAERYTEGFSFERTCHIHTAPPELFSFVVGILYTCRPYGLWVVYRGKQPSTLTLIRNPDDLIAAEAEEGAALQFEGIAFFKAVRKVLC
jgi:hypothetical protein